MRWPRSLQWRLALGIGAGIALLWAVAVLVAADRVGREVDAVLDGALAEAAQRILPLAVVDIIGRDDDDEFEPEQRMATLRDAETTFSWVVRDGRGAVLLRSHNADPAIFPPFTRSGFASTATHRLYSDAAVRGTITITVAEPLAGRRAVVETTLLRLALPAVLAIPLGLLVVWAVVRATMAPLRRFRAGIEARHGGDLAPLGTDALPAEIRPVAQAVNRLLDRLRRALEAERAFTANAAHELRTPVAAALAQTQLLAAGTAEAPTRARAEQIEAALRRLARLAEKLMQLARAEGGRLEAAETVDLSRILRLLCEEMDREAAGRIALALPDAPVRARIDPDAFAILARNLIENALKHGAAGAPVRVALAEGGVLRVLSDGPVVPAEMLARLAAPFERGRAQAAGSGLGLAIARAIAAGSGGRLDLLSPPEGEESGFEARFTAPGRAA